MNSTQYTLMSEGGQTILEGMEMNSIVDCGSRSTSYAIFCGEGNRVELTQENLEFCGTDILVKGLALEEALRN